MSKSSSQTVLVTGATGTTGSALLRLLEERGCALRAMIRHKQDIAKLGDTSARGNRARDCWSDRTRGQIHRRFA
jgi:NADP-dependent 3-hydroxy acid dehydrogenase YdfG